MRPVNCLCVLKILPMSISVVSVKDRLKIDIPAIITVKITIELKNFKSIPGLFFIIYPFSLYPLIHFISHFPPNAGLSDA